MLSGLGVHSTFRLFVPALLATAFLASFGSGCGSYMQSTTPPPTPPQTATVPISMTATANDQLSEFVLALTSITLTNNKGMAVPVLNSTDSLEFIHSNGTASPIKNLEHPARRIHGRDCDHRFCLFYVRHAQFIRRTCLQRFCQRTNSLLRCNRQYALAHHNRWQSRRSLS